MSAGLCVTSTMVVLAVMARRSAPRLRASVCSSMRPSACRGARHPDAKAATGNRDHWRCPAGYAACLRLSGDRAFWWGEGANPAFRQAFECFRRQCLPARPRSGCPAGSGENRLSGQ